MFLLPIPGTITFDGPHLALFLDWACHLATAAGGDSLCWATSSAIPIRSDANNTFPQTIVDMSSGWDQMRDRPGTRNPYYSPMLALVVLISVGFFNHCGQPRCSMASLPAVKHVS